MAGTIKSQNIPVINLTQGIDIIRSQFNESNLRPILWLGKGGIGKTESITELANDLGIGFVDIRLLLYLESDLKGIPYPDKDHTSTIWLQNNILPTVEKNGLKGILLFDEITSAPKSVRTAAYQLLQERKLGEYTLPDGWLIICAGNGEDDGGDFQGLEAIFGNRCSIFNVIAELDSWKSWGNTHGVNDLVLAYVSFKQSDLHTFNPDNDNDLLFASPRSWKAVSDILNKRGYASEDELLNLRVLSNIGTIVGNSFLSFCKYKKSTVDPHDILNGVQVPKIKELEVLFITMQSLLTLLRNEITKNIQKQELPTDDMLKKTANFVNWALSLENLEHQIMILKDFGKINAEFVGRILVNDKFRLLCPGLRTFIQKNKNVLK